MSGDYVRPGEHDRLIEKADELRHQAIIVAYLLTERWVASELRTAEVAVRARFLAAYCMSFVDAYEEALG